MPQPTEQGLDGSQGAKPTPPANPPAVPVPSKPDFGERHDDPEQAEELERQQDA